MNIILVTADTLKAKTLEIEKNNIPNIEFLRKNGFEFRNHFVSSPWTGASFASFFTGAYPKQHGFILNCPEIKNFSEPPHEEEPDGVSFKSFNPDKENHFTKTLKKTHYCIGIQGNSVCHEERFGRHFHEYKEDFNSRLMEKIFRFSRKIRLFPLLMKIKRIKDNAKAKLFKNKYQETAKLFNKRKANIPVYKTAETLTDRTIKKIKANKNKDFFLWINFVDMHAPYTDLYNLSSKPEYKKINCNKTELFDLIYNLKNKLTETEKKFVEEKYHAKIRLIDSQIGRIIECLKENSLFEKTSIIFSSDHGEEFWEHGTKRDDKFFYTRGVSHGHTLYNELIKVPLFIYSSSISPKKINKLTSCVNIYNTVLEIAGAEKNPELPPSLIDIALNKKEMDYVIAESILFGKERKTVIDKNNFKLIKGTEDNKTELFDLNNDPKEKNDIAEQNPKKTKEMLDRLFFYI
ncbi:MAG: sulfatase-like hydrolase/transferase [archaeon]